MRKWKATWTVLGLVVASLLVCGSARAQTAGAGPQASQGSTRAGEPPTQPSLEENKGAAPSAASGTARAPAQAPAGSTDLWRTIADLQREVAQLRADVADLRAQLGTQGVGGAGAGGQAGTGGGGQAGGAVAAGQAGAGGANAQAGTGGGGTGGTATGQAGTGGTADTGARASVATATYTGRVQDVRPDSIIIGDAVGNPLTLEVDGRTRVFSGNRRISLQELQKGTQVQATVDLLASGRNTVKDIIVVPRQGGGGR